MNMSIESLKEVLAKHLLWLQLNKDGVRANLVRANLVGANLVGANLVRANLDGANLVRANLDGANLDGANLVRANLVGANLDGANLVGANLDGANLVGANLVGAKNAPLLASVSWTDHGECGRMLTAMLHESTGPEIVYHCGCFRNGEAELRAYIAKGPIEYRESRTQALDFVADRMAEMIAKRKPAA